MLDGLVARVLATYPYRFTLAVTSDERRVAYALRHDAAVRAGWVPPDASGLESDRYDEGAVHVVGWDDERPISTGRLVLPPDPLPTEDECGIVVEPASQVVEVGRMCVVSTYQSYRHAAFIALLSRLYLQMREAGYEHACGMMSPQVRRLMRQLGLTLDQLGEDRPYWREDRAPVRFALLANTGTLTDRWR